MNKIINLKDIEVKVFTATFKDGLLDIALAVIFSQFAAAPLLTDIGYSDFEASFFFVPVYILAFLILFLVKKYITKPRMGVIKPVSQRKSKLIKVNISLLLILFCGFLLGLLFPAFYPAAGIIFPLTLSIILLVAFSLSAYYLDLGRLYYYGILTAFAPFAGEILWRYGMTSHHGYPLMFGGISLFLLVFGIIHFVRFLHENPRPVMEKNNAG